MNRANLKSLLRLAVIVAAVLMLAAVAAIAQVVPPAPVVTSPSASDQLMALLGKYWGPILVAIGFGWLVFTGKINLKPTPTTLPPPVVPPPVVPPPIIPPPVNPGHPVIDTITALLPILIQYLFPLIVKARREGREEEAVALQGIIDKSIEAASALPK